MSRDRFRFLEGHGFVYRHRETVAGELPAKLEILDAIQV
jgi:hypothetical protein